MSGTHSCFSCRPGPDRVIDHGRGVVHVPRTFRGPPTSIHGGAAAGLVACLGDAHLAEPTARFNLRLHAPPPVGTDLPYRVEVEPDGQRLRFEVEGPAGVVLSGWTATATATANATASSTPTSGDQAEPAVPPDTVADLAAHATLSPAERAAFDRHPDQGPPEFSECFGCGVANDVGLQLRTRPIDGRRGWIDWVPEPRWYDGDLVATLPAIAALDCTSSIPFRPLGLIVEGESCLLGTYDGEIHRRPPVRADGSSYRIVTAPRRREGRKIWADIGLFDPDGGTYITGCATWIVTAQPPGS